MIQSYEVEDWKQNKVTKEFLRQLNKCEDELLKRPTTSDNVDKMVVQTCMKQGGLNMIGYIEEIIEELSK